MKAVIKIDGMMCGHCAQRVTGVLKDAGAQTVDISLEQKYAEVTFDSDTVSLETLERAVFDAGYDVIK